MEKQRETTVLGYIGTTTGIHSLIPVLELIRNAMLSNYLGGKGSDY